MKHQQLHPSKTINKHDSFSLTDSPQDLSGSNNNWLSNNLQVITNNSNRQRWGGDMVRQTIILAAVYWNSHTDTTTVIYAHSFKTEGLLVLLLWFSKSKQYCSEFRSTINNWLWLTRYTTAVQNGDDFKTLIKISVGRFYEKFVLNCGSCSILLVSDL